MFDKVSVFIFVAFLACFGFSVSAGAQSCDFSYEQIFEIRDGRLGAFSVWDAVLGDLENAERYASAVQLEDSFTLAVGEVAPQGDDKAESKLLLVKLDYRGRKVWSKAHEVKGLSEVIKILRAGDQFLVLANLQEGRKHSAWSGIFDVEGNLVSGAAIIHPKAPLQARDIAPSEDGKGFVMTALMGGHDEATHSALYFLNSKGQAVSHREYVTGPENTLDSIVQATDELGGYVGAGSIVAEDGRKAGWIVRLNKDGSILWQQQYVRGTGSHLLKAVPFKDRYFVSTGFADPHPLEGTQRAGWVMMVESRSGDVAWQRYYTGSYKYSARDVIVADDGLISVLLDGAWDRKKDSDEDEAQQEDYDPAKDLGERKDMDYANLLTIDPRGHLLSSDPFYNGEGSDAAQLYFGERGMRMLVGSTDMLYKIEAVAEQPAMEKRSVEGWFVAASPTEPYTDPCLQ